MSILAGEGPLALFALETSYQDIRYHIVDFFGISVSNGTINAVTDKLLPTCRLGVSAIRSRLVRSSGSMPV